MSDLSENYQSFQIPQIDPKTGEASPITTVRYLDATEPEVLRTYVTDTVDETDVSDLRGVVPFANEAERVAAFSNPRYRHDSLYRHDCAKRTAAMKR
jgi:hypothetical protein